MLESSEASSLPASWLPSLQAMSKLPDTFLDKNVNINVNINVYILHVKAKNLTVGAYSVWKTERAQICNLDRRRSPNRIGRASASKLIISTMINEPKIQIHAERLISLLRMPAIKRW